MILSDWYIGQNDIMIIGYSRWVCQRVIYWYAMFSMVIVIVGDVKEWLMVSHW